jgi:Asp-tRNA(Asn)/Glu-tRNA(Gln) amidotransferase A subunit family amidase
VRDVPLGATADVKSLRIGYDPAAFNDDSETFKKFPELKPLYRAALDQLRTIAGKDFTPVTLPATRDYNGLASLVIACESACNFADLLTSGDIRKLKQQGDGTWPNTFRVGSTIPAADYLRGSQVRTQLMRAMAEAMRDVDLYLTIPYAGPTIAYTNLTGHPSLVCRAGIVKGRPKLIEFIGQPFREDALLALAHAFERSTDHNAVWPDTSKIPPLS